MNLRMKKSLEAFGLRWSRTRERGATAVVIALCLLVILGAAAISFDTANLALKRQTLQNVTDAAAQAGASYLPDAAAAKQGAIDYFTLNMPGYTPDISLWCMVASTGATKQPASGAVSATTCDPHPGATITYANGVDSNGEGKTVCDENLCAIPCGTLSGATCNAVRVLATKPVPFFFAPAIGIKEGSTGAVSSVSCSNGCVSKGVKVTAMDVAIVADRTPSMLQYTVKVNNQNVSAFSVMQASIEKSLTTMTPEYQFVTLGTIHKSNSPSSEYYCKTLLGNQAGGPPGTGGPGKWMPTDFYNNYLTGNLGDTGRTLDISKNTTTKTATLGYQVQCMNSLSGSSAPWNTHLAAPLKAAARLLLGKSGTSSSLTAMSVARSTLTNNAPVSKWVIFETDGEPVETEYASNDTSLDSATDPSAPGNPKQACANLLDVAARAKAAKVNIIMIAFGGSTTAKCGTSYVRDVMAQAASPKNLNPSTPSTAPSDCATANTDGDFFFCATTGDELSNIFSTAIGAAGSVSPTKFVRMPT